MPETPADKARELLKQQTGAPVDRAQVWATLAVAEALAPPTSAGMRIESEPILGTVMDAGGGEIRLRVDRDAANYPAVNTEVELRVR